MPTKTKAPAKWNKRLIRKLWMFADDENNILEVEGREIGLIDQDGAPEAFFADEYDADAKCIDGLYWPIDNYLEE